MNICIKYYCRSVLACSFCFLVNFTIAQEIDSTGEEELSEQEEKAVINGKFDKKLFPNVKDSIDITELLPPPGEQGRRGSCWAWATTYAIRSFMDNRDKRN